MRWLAGEQWASLKDLPEDQQLLVVTVAQEFQHWALVERVCEESVVQASRKLERAAFLARLGVEIAEKVRGPEGWRNRVRGYAEAHGPNVLRVAGELQAAAAGIGEAKRLWEKGEDPLEVLDPGRLLNLEGALCRDQGRFSEALAILDQAVTVGRFPELALIQKGLTLEATGEYDHAVETLFKAQTLVELREDVRLGNIVQFNLAVNLCHEGRYTEAIELVHKVCELSSAMGDEIGFLRSIWLKGHIAAGLDRTGEARMWLEHARGEFVVRRMWYDAALTLLEIAILLLKEGQVNQVRTLAQDLIKIFESKGVHLKALAALQLFYKAAEREQVTVELARQVLRYMYRARHDQGLQFCFTNL